RRTQHRGRSRGLRSAPAARDLRGRGRQLGPDGAAARGDRRTDSTRCRQTSGAAGGLKGERAMATILIADDAAFMRMKSATLIRDMGHEVIEAADGQEAVDLFKSAKPDAVLMDITMPNKDGMEALREIVALDPNARVAMVTAMGQQQIVMEA